MIKNTFLKYIFLLFVALTITFCGKSKAEIYAECMVTSSNASVYLFIEDGYPYFQDGSGETLSLEQMNDINRVHQSFSEVYFLYIDTYGIDIFKALELEESRFDSYVSSLKSYYGISDEEYTDLMDLGNLTIINYFSNRILWFALQDENETAYEFCELWDSYDSFGTSFNE